jgi:hypothetical protein
MRMMRVPYHIVRADFLGLTRQAVVFRHPIGISILLAVYIFPAFVGRRQRLFA